MSETDRPESCPKEGMVPAFDAGWNAHKVGLGRETVEVLSHPSGRSWALMGYDVRALIASRLNPKTKCSHPDCGRGPHTDGFHNFD